MTEFLSGAPHLPDTVGKPMCHQTLVSGLLQHAATRTATHRNTLQHTATNVSSDFGLRLVFGKYRALVMNSVNKFPP